jgi:dihydrofolate reductase
LVARTAIAVAASTAMPHASNARPNPAVSACAGAACWASRSLVRAVDGGTTFHFVTDGIEAAMKRARDAAGDGDISIHGGATTVNQYLAAGLINEMRLHIAPLMLGAGPRLFDGVPPLNVEQVESRPASSVTHLTYRVLS